MFLSFSSALQCWHKVYPSITGIRISETMRSGMGSCIIWRAALPFAASRTSHPCFSIRLFSRYKLSALSSTMTTFVFICSFIRKAIRTDLISTRRHVFIFVAMSMDRAQPTVAESKKHVTVIIFSLNPSESQENIVSSDLQSDRRSQRFLCCPFTICERIMRGRII
ncbi:MAG: hypothetical protein BWX99_01925 [Deltaproteobacteria bacterium ADurb.Bin151]|nr:MAG: hypothetical protein BWX99_01925 [Deltaproteobacteria bacterium ADurb.Bin151]